MDWNLETFCSVRSYVCYWWNIGLNAALLSVLCVWSRDEWKAWKMKFLLLWKQYKENVFKHTSLSERLYVEAIKQMENGDYTVWYRQYSSFELKYVYSRFQA